MSALTLPTVHSNGTGPRMLVEGYRDAYTACERAREAIAAIEFNARDYYPQGPDAWAKARAEHDRRLAMVEQVQTELLAIAMHVQSMKGGAL